MTPEAFESIRVKKSIFPNILQIIREFGSKTYDSLPQHCSFRSGRSDREKHVYGTSMRLRFSFWD
jgi:hypothetical protein